MTAWLVHGFNVRDGGAASIDRLRPHLEARGWTVRDLDYGWRGLLGVRLCNAGTAATLASLSDPADAAIGHSNGCAIIRRAVVAGARFARIVLINPALDRDTEWPGHTGAIEVWHAPSDVATWAARWLLFHPWGDMGRHGGDGRWYVNHDADRIASEAAGRRVELGHSGVFSDRWISTFGPLIAASVGNEEPPADGAEIRGL